MGKLKPDTSYIYEQANGIIYAREFGSTDRFEIGRNAERVKTDSLEKELWNEIFVAAQTNDALQSELERVKILYLLMKKQDSEIQHHPV